MRAYRPHRGSVKPVTRGLISTCLLLGMTALAWGDPGAESGVQVLTRGPVHEAFASASMTGSTAGVVIARAPYEPVTEVPPDLRPEGDDVAWIPGYWCWDDDRSDFIWVSGVWRDLPPGREIAWIELTGDDGDLELTEMVATLRETARALGADLVAMVRIDRVAGAVRVIAVAMRR